MDGLNSHLKRLIMKYYQKYKMCANEDKIGKILWSIALPGFGQILNGQLLKGALFIILEFLVNIKANINEIIILSFQGNLESAIKQTNYQWLMFYPCIYMFAIYDAYRNAKGTIPPFAFLPFFCSAILGTIGVIYSSTFRIWGIQLGPILLTLICFILGIAIGKAISLVLIKYN